jgi:hypothetical protein
LHLMGRGSSFARRRDPPGPWLLCARRRQREFISFPAWTSRWRRSVAARDHRSYKSCSLGIQDINTECHAETWFGWRLFLLGLAFRSPCRAGNRSPDRWRPRLKEGIRKFNGGCAGRFGRHSNKQRRDDCGSSCRTGLAGQTKTSHFECTVGQCCILVRGSCGVQIKRWLPPATYWRRLMWEAVLHEQHAQPTFLGCGCSR